MILRAGRHEKKSAMPISRKKRCGVDTGTFLKVRVSDAAIRGISLPRFVEGAGKRAAHIEDENQGRVPLPHLEEQGIPLFGGVYKIVSWLKLRRSFLSRAVKKKTKHTFCY